MSQHNQESQFVLRVLGPFDLILQGVSVADQLPHKAQLLLALLALRPDRWQTRIELAAMLWPESYASDGATSLRRLLSQLRHILKTEAGRLQQKDHALRLDLNGAQVDVIDFQESVRCAEQSDPEIHLKNACQLYRGPVMEKYEEGCLVSMRKDFQRVYRKVLYELADRIATQGDRARAQHYLRQALAATPEHEPTACFLLRLLLDAGEKEQAREVYRQFTQTLQETGSAWPSPEMQALGKALHPASPDTPQSDPSRRHLPAPLTSLVGREQERAGVRARLCQSRLVTLVGPGGVGKTRLAAEIAHELRNGFEDGTAFADLSALPHTTPLLTIVLTIKEAFPDLSIREVPGRSLIQVLAEVLAEKRLLLVLDNCEQVLLYCARIVHELLQACPALHILATSREALRVSGEFLCNLPPLSLPPREYPVSLSSVRQSHAVQLFIARTRARVADFEITAENVAALATICHALDGIPLALELAAAMTDALSLEALAVSLPQDYWMLGDGGNLIQPERYQNLQAGVAWGYRTLSPEAKALLNRISVLAGDWEAEAAHAVCPSPESPSQTLRVLSQLVHRSLLVQEPRAHGPRYRLLGAVRQYAREQLLESGEMETTRARHAAHYHTRVAAIAPALAGEQQKTACETLYAEQDNLRAALQWAWESGESVMGLEFSVGLWRFWMVRAYFAEGLEWLDRFLALPGDALPDLRLEAYLAGGNLAYSQTDYLLARQYYEKALALAQGSENAVIRARIGANLGNVANALGDYTEARTRFEQSLDAFQKANNKKHVALALATLATLESRTGHYERACAYGWEALQMGLAPQNRALALNNLCDSLLRLGRQEEVLPLLAESAQISQEIGSRPDMLHCLYNFLALAIRRHASETAGVLIGVIDAFQETYGVRMVTSSHAEMDAFRDSVRTQLGEQCFEAARRRGYTLPQDQWELPRIVELHKANSLASGGDECEAWAGDITDQRTREDAENVAVLVGATDRRVYVATLAQA